MVFFVFLIVFLFINIVLLLFSLFPMLKAFFTDNMPLDGSFEFRFIYDWAEIMYFYFFVIWTIIFIIFNICNIVYLINKIKNNNIEIIKKYCRIIKIIIIPFWIIIIILYFGSSYIFYITYNMALFDMPMPIIISYIILLSTSSYSISYLTILKKNGIININQFLKNVIFQLFFITDIIGVFKIIKNDKKSKRKIFMNFRVIGKVGFLLVIIGFLMPMAGNSFGFYFGSWNGFGLLGVVDVVSSILLIGLFILGIVGIIIGIALLRGKDIPTSLEKTILVACIGIVIINLMVGLYNLELQSGFYVIIVGLGIALIGQIISFFHR